MFVNSPEGERICRLINESQFQISRIQTQESICIFTEGRRNCSHNTLRDKVEIICPHSSRHLSADVTIVIVIKTYCQYDAHATSCLSSDMFDLRNINPSCCFVMIICFICEETREKDTDMQIAESWGTRAVTRAEGVGCKECCQVNVIWWWEDFCLSLQSTSAGRTYFVLKGGVTTQGPSLPGHVWIVRRNFGN